MDKPKFEIGVNVFAKMKGFPPWPAVIEGIHDLTPKRIKYSVYFYGTRQVAVIKEQDMFSYSEHKEKLGKPRKSSSFNLSMAEAEENIFNLNLEGSTQHLLASVEDKAEETLLCANSGGSTEDLSRPYYSDTLDKDTSLQKELRLTELILNIQRSISLHSADFNQCIKCLKEIEDLDVNDKVMLLKDSDILLTLVRLKNYRPTQSVKSLPQCDVKVSIIKNKVSKLLHSIQTLFPTKNGQSFIQAYEEELEKFDEKTKKLTKRELMLLTTEDYKPEK